VMAVKSAKLFMAGLRKVHPRTSGEEPSQGRLNPV
jgi:hypothetical protein